MDLKENNKKAAWDIIISGSGSSLIIIGGELHIIGGCQNGKHFKWN